MVKCGFRATVAFSMPTALSCGWLVCVHSAVRVCVSLRWMNESDAVVVFALTIGRTVHCQQPSATRVCSSSPQSARERWTEPTTLPNESALSKRHVDAHQ